MCVYIYVCLTKGCVVNIYCKSALQNQHTFFLPTLLEPPPHCPFNVYEHSALYTITTSLKPKKPLITPQTSSQVGQGRLQVPVL